MSVIKKPPLISVVIPVHNPGKYLRDCLDCVKRQTLENLEVIIVDDDSTDDSKKIIEQYGEIDDRFKYYFVKHHNAALTRKEGINNSSGDYVCFVDSDDIVSNDYVEVLYNALTETNLELAAAKMRTFREGDVINQSTKNTNEVHTEDDVLSYFCNNYFLLEGGGYVAQSMGAKIFSKRSLENLDYSVIKSAVLEDNYVISQVLRNVYPQKIALVDHTVYFYRQHENSTMADVLIRRIDYGRSTITYPELFEKTMDYIKDLYKDHPSAEANINKLKYKEYYAIAKARTEHVLILNDQIKETQNETSKIKDELSVKSDKVDELLSSLDELLNSKAYRIGTAIMRPLRLLKKWSAFIGHVLKHGRTK